MSRTTRDISTNSIQVLYFRRHSLSKRRIVPLPIWKANPETDPGALFTKGAVSFFKIYYNYLTIADYYSSLFFVQLGFRQI